jgi:TolB protein
VAGVFSCAGVAVAEGQAKSGQLVFTANVGTGNWDIGVGGLDSRAVAPLFQMACDESDPRWSPDRKTVVYSATDGRLYAVDVETRQAREVASEDPSPLKTGPCFSPDGKKIVYSRLNGRIADDTDLAVYDLQTKTVRTLVRQYGPQFDPDWSPDGKTIVYASTHCSADCGRVVQELWLASSEGGYARQLLMTHSLCIRPRWSPDGKRLAFSSDKGGNFDIWVLSLDDGALRQVTTDLHLDTSPAWSPDGSRLAFVSGRTGRMRIWVADLKTGSEQMLWLSESDKLECRDVAW